MKYCKKCLQPDTRPSIVFNEDGICGACVYEESKKTIDWVEREKELQEICKWAKDNTSCAYDCVIGVSGGKDSTFQALIVKEKYGMNPLLVCNAPDGRTAVGTHNIENLRSYGFDLIEIRPDPNVMRNLTKRDFLKKCHPVRSSEYSLWSSAYRIAIEKKIPLVIQGENPALTLGIQGDGIDGGNALTIKNHNTLQGCNADNIVITEEEAKLYDCEPVTRKQLEMFEMPNFEGVDIKGIFLQYYEKSWSQVGNADFSIARGLKGRTEEKLEDLGRYRRFTSVDSDIHPLSQMLKYLQLGFGFAIDEVCYDIREGRLTREEGIYLVNRYDGKCGEQYIKAFCDYINITELEFWNTVRQFMNKELFDCNMKPKFVVGEDFGEA